MEGPLRELTDPELEALVFRINPEVIQHEGGASLYAQALLEAWRRDWIMIDPDRPAARARHERRQAQLAAKA